MSFQLIDTLQDQIEQLDAQGLRRRRRTAETACAPQVTVDGRPVLSFNSNDYLGLAADARIAAALQEGVRRYGAGSGASHLVSGHSRAHEELEERLAAFEAPHLEHARALYFSTGYMANLAVLTALAAATPGEAEIFSDALNHASIIDGTRLARAKVTVYAHNDAAALEQALTASVAKNRIVVTDSVFSMDGDIAPLPQLLALCERHGAWLVVDDAHGFGVLGEHGRGALEHFNLRSPQLVYMGTLGKAAGVSGAFVAAHAIVIDWLVQRARPYIYTTAAAPALAHALLTSLALIDSREGQQRRAQLELLRHQLSDPVHGLAGVAQVPCRDGMQGAKRSWADAQQGFATPQTARQGACPPGWGEIGRFAHQIPCMGSEPMLRDLGGQLIPIAPQRDPCEAVNRVSAMPLRRGWSHLASDTPIQPLVIGGNAEVLAAAQALLDQGLWVSAIRAPTVPVGTARLRITLSATHTHDDVARLLDALHTIAETETNVA